MAKLTTLDDDQLTTAGFTPPGVDQFTKTVADYSDELLRRTLLKADADRLGSDREATSSHVRASAREIASKPKSKPLSKWSIAGQIGEYLFTAGAGVGAGQIGESLFSAGAASGAGGAGKDIGVLTFGVCLACATVLLVIRLVARGREA